MSISVFKIYSLYYSTEKQNIFKRKVIQKLYNIPANDFAQIMKKGDTAVKTDSIIISENKDEERELQDITTSDMPKTVTVTPPETGQWRKSSSPLKPSHLGSKSELGNEIFKEMENMDQLNDRLSPYLTDDEDEECGKTTGIYCFFNSF